LILGFYTAEWWIPAKKVPDLNCGVGDLLLEVVYLKQEVPDLRSGGTPHNFTPADDEVAVIAGVRVQVVSKPNDSVIYKSYTGKLSTTMEARRSRLERMQTLPNIKLISPTSSPSRSVLGSTPEVPSDDPPRPLGGRRRQDDVVARQAHVRGPVLPDGQVAGAGRQQPGVSMPPTAAAGGGRGRRAGGAAEGDSDRSAGRWR